MNKYYTTKWDNLTDEESYTLSEYEEKKLINFLIDKCKFKRIIHTGKNIVDMAKEKGLILPDIEGKHKNKETYFIELKSKNRRMKFNDNGIDFYKAEAYLKAQQEYDWRVLIVFIDDEKEWKTEYPSVNSWFKDDNGNCTYYGNWIDKLYKETPQNPITITWSNYKKIICFPLSNMKKITDIFKERQTHLNFEVLK